MVELAEGSEKVWRFHVGGGSNGATFSLSMGEHKEGEEKVECPEPLFKRKDS